MGCESDQEYEEDLELVRIGGRQKREERTSRRPRSGRTRDKVHPLELDGGSSGGNGSSSSSDLREVVVSDLTAVPSSPTTAATGPDNKRKGRRADTSLDSSTLTAVTSRYGPQTFTSNGKMYTVAMESLSWTKCKNSEGRTFYYSPLTGQATWTRPKEYIDPGGWYSSEAQLSSLQSAFEICMEYGVELLLFGDVANPPSGRGSAGITTTEPWHSHDSVYGGAINGYPPILGHCLFYQPFLVSELSVYPKSFLARCGLQRIVLVDSLKYKRQSRKAIPVVQTGTLYLDPKPEAIQYMHSVFHHELFHLFDDKMLSQLKGRFEFLPGPPPLASASKLAVLEASAPTSSEKTEPQRSLQSHQVNPRFTRHPKLDNLQSFASQILRRYIEEPEDVDLSRLATSVIEELKLDVLVHEDLENPQRIVFEFICERLESVVPSVPLSYLVQMLTKGVAFSDCPPVYELSILLYSAHAHDQRRAFLHEVNSILKVDSRLSLADSANADNNDGSETVVSSAFRLAMERPSVASHKGEDDDEESDSSQISEGSRIVTKTEGREGDKQDALEARYAPEQDDRSEFPKSPRETEAVLSLVDRQPFTILGNLRSQSEGFDRVKETKDFIRLTIPDQMVEEVCQQRLYEQACHSVDLEKIGSDPIWLLLNPPGFCYGGGGHKLRTKTSTFSMTHYETRARLSSNSQGRRHVNYDEKVDPAALEPTGFLNEYSMSGIEEDKAELYAALVRSYTAVVHSRDPYIAAKGRELMRRLQLFCPEMSESFFQRAHEHQPFPVVDAYQDHWVQRVDRRGYPHWFNTKTHQTSWIDPATFLTKPPPPQSHEPSSGISPITPQSDRQTVSEADTEPNMLRSVPGSDHAVDITSEEATTNIVVARIDDNVVIGLH